MPGKKGRVKRSPSQKAYELEGRLQKNKIKKLKRHTKKHPTDKQSLSSSPINYGKKDLTRKSLNDERWKLYLKLEK